MPAGSPGQRRGSSARSTNLYAPSPPKVTSSSLFKAKDDTCIGVFSAPMAAEAIGIDLGTTFSCVGVFKNGGVEIISNDAGDKTTPSIVAFTDTERLVGAAARNQAARNPKNTIYGVKRLIGRSFSDPAVQADTRTFPFQVVQASDGRPEIQVEYKGKQERFRTEQISSFVLEKMKKTAETYLGHPVKDAVITVPAYFTDAQRRATKDAASIAGLNVLRIINEPTAAALCYGMNKIQGERNVLVFDLGGGTFDVTALVVEDGVFEVKATGGDCHLGGEDFDSRIVEFLIQEFEKKHRGSANTLRSNPRTMRRLRTAAERAKRELSAAHRTTIEIDAVVDGEDLVATLTRARFEEMCMDLFKGCIATVDKVLTDSQLSKPQIADIVLVGGSTRIPKIRSMLQAHFNGKELHQGVHPDEAVAYGAAVQAAILTDHVDDALKDTVVLDVTPLSLGIETAGGLMTKLVERNASIPCTKTESFSTFEDNQPAVTVQVFEGERKFTRDNHLLGRFNLEGIPPAPRGVPRINVKFSIDANGMLEVAAEDQGTGQSKSITITNDSSRLTADQIREMQEDAERHAADDERAAAKVVARNDTQGFAYTVRSQLNDEKIGGKLDPEAKRLALSKADALIEWLDAPANENLEVEAYEAKKKDLEATVQPLFATLYQQTGGAAGGAEMPPSATGPIVEEMD